MGELIAVLSGKGGTGKTSVCAGLAEALAEEQQKVLCIDCDIGLRNLDISLGLADTCPLSFLDVSEGTYVLEQVPPHPLYPTLFFLTAPMNCRSEQVDSESFAALLEQARYKYDYVLLDAPAGIDAGFRLAARCADRILLVTGADPASIRDAGRAGEVLELMGKTEVRLIVNRISAKLASSVKITVDDIMDRAGLPLIGVVPEDSRVILSASVSKPLLKASRKGAAAACRRIAKRIRGRSVAIPF